MERIYKRLEMPHLAGVYKITHKVSGKIYIGKSINMHKRFIGYQQDLQKGKKRFILNAIRKYGWDSFEIKILEPFPLGTKNEILLEREMFWIKFFKSNERGIGYNLCLRGRDRTGVSLTEEHKRRIGEANRGKKRFIDDKWRENMSKAQLGKVRTPEGKRNVALGKRFYKKVLQIDPKTKEIIAEWDLLSEAEDLNGIGRNGVRYHAKVGTPIGGFLWEIKY